MIKKIKLFTLCLTPLLFLGCASNYISVQKIKTDKLTFASRFAHTPDPRAFNPPKGEKLYISWTLPIELTPNMYRLKVGIVYRNLTTETLVYPIKRKAGSQVIELLGKEFTQKEGYLAYKIEIIDLEGKVFTDYTHRMWVDLILPCNVEG